MDPEAKPQCGGGGLEPEDTYDYPLHVGAVFIVLAASIIGCGFPVVAKKVKWLSIPPKVFFITKHFGTGVLIATAFVHLLPTAFYSLSDPCLPDLFTDDYPALPGVIMMTSLLSLFVLELYINGKTGGHSHGGATGESLVHNAAPMGHAPSMRRTDTGISGPMPMGMSPPTYRSRRSLSTDNYPRGESPYPEEKRGRAMGSPYDNYDDPEHLEAQSEMPAWFIAFYAQYIRQRDEMKKELSAAMPAAPFHQVALGHADHHGHVAPPALTSGFDAEEKMVDPAVLKKMSMNITLLEGGILFHSIFVGMTISITNKGFVILLAAIIFHQFFEGLGLGSRIAEVPYPQKSIRPWMLVLAFGTTCPIGQVIGLLTRSSYDPNSAFALILVGSFNAFSSGLLIYAAIVDLLAEDFLSEEGMLMTKNQKITGVIYVFLGALGMAIVGAFA